MKIVYNREKAPSFIAKSIFLAGPTPRDKKNESWRDEALDILKEKGYDGVVFVPEDNPKTPDIKFPDFDTDPEGYKEQVDWENTWLNSVDIILFWIPRKLPDFPGFTTNVEYGRYFETGKIVVGAPKDSEKNTYLKVIAEKAEINWHDKLEDCITEAIERIGKGSHRTGYERYVPLLIWNHPTFKSWADSMESNDLKCSIENINSRFVFIPQVNKNVFFFVVHPHVKIKKEDNRIKTNEFVIGRTDLCTLVVHTETEDPLDSRLVLIKEFRCPVRNSSGYVYELPSGSINLEGDPIDHAIEEFEEETGVKIKKSKKVVKVNERQCLATYSAHTNNVYSFPIDDEMMDKIEKDTKGKHFGIESDTEMTYVEIRTVREILSDNLVDFSMLGVIFETLFKKEK